MPVAGQRSLSRVLRTLLQDDSEGEGVSARANFGARPDVRNEHSRVRPHRVAGWGMRFLIVALAFAAVAACDTSPLEPLPFQVGIEASRATAAPGDTINFLVTAQGGSLIGVITNYGDDSTDSFGTSGARTARV